MTAQKQKISIGAVQPIPKGIYNPTLDYGFLNIVRTDNAVYICRNRLGAPSGTSITDEQYWDCLARDGEDGAVTFATAKEYQNERADRAVSPALIRPILTALETRQAAFEEFGKAFDSERLGGKTLSEVRSGIDAEKLDGHTLTEVLEASAEGQIGANGWVKLGSGLIIQWGTATLTKNKWTETVTLPVPFPTANLWATVSTAGSISSNDDGVYSYAIALVSSKTLSTIVLTRPYALTATIQYLAIGY